MEPDPRRCWAPDCDDGKLRELGWWSWGGRQVELCKFRASLHWQTLLSHPSSIFSSVSPLVLPVDSDHGNHRRRVLTWNYLISSGFFITFTGQRSGLTQLHRLLLPELRVTGIVDLEGNLTACHCAAEVIFILHHFREHHWPLFFDFTSLQKCQLSQLLNCSTIDDQPTLVVQTYPAFALPQPQDARDPHRFPEGLKLEYMLNAGALH